MVSLSGMRRGRWSWPISVPWRPETEEIGFREALNWLVENFYRKIILELDSLLLVSALKSNIQYSNNVGLIIHDFKAYLEHPPESSVMFLSSTLEEELRIWW